MYASQLESYRTAQKATMTGREIEAAALTRSALKLADCRNNWETIVRDAGRLEESLTFNQKIWTILQSELAKDDNPLPKQTKEDLLSLSLFVDKRTFDILAFPQPEKLSVLININLNVAAGLRGSAPK